MEKRKIENVGVEITGITKVWHLQYVLNQFLKIWCLFSYFFYFGVYDGGSSDNNSKTKMINLIFLINVILNDKTPSCQNTKNCLYISEFWWWC